MRIISSHSAYSNWKFLLVKGANEEPEIIKNKQTETTHNLTTDVRPLKSQSWENSLLVITLGIDNKSFQTAGLKIFQVGRSQRQLLPTAMYF